MMPPFPDELIFKDVGHVNGSMILMVQQDFRFFSSTGCVTVPKHFVSDGASVPRIFWNVLSPFGNYFKAALVHDYLYSHHNLIYTREEADDIFMEGMYLLGVPLYQRFPIYCAVKLFGGWHYKGKRK